MSEAIAFPWGAHRARLQNCFAHSKGSTNDDPLACNGGASRPRRAALPHPVARPAGSPHPHPRPCNQWESNCFAIGPAREQFCRRAPCAPKGRAMAKHKGKRFQKRRGERKNCDSHQPFSSAASPMACERGVILTSFFTSSSASPMACESFLILISLSRQRHSQWRCVLEAPEIPAGGACSPRLVCETFIWPLTNAVGS